MKGRFAKRYLITENEYRKLYDNNMKKSSLKLNHPNLERAKNIKAKMEVDNANPLLSDFDKVLNYTSNLANFLNNVQRSLTIPKTRAILGRKNTPPPPPPSSQQGVDIPDLLPPPFPETDIPPPVLEDDIFFETPEPTPSSSNRYKPYMRPKKLHRVDEFYTPNLSSVSTPIRAFKNSSPLKPSTNQVPNQSKVEVEKKKVEVEEKKTRPDRSSSQKFSREYMLKDFSSEEREVVGSQLDHLLGTGKFNWNPNTGKIFLETKTLPNANVGSLVEDLRTNTRNFSDSKEFDKVFSLLYGQKSNGSSPLTKGKSKGKKSSR
jgi:hypothetical protein